MDVSYTNIYEEIVIKEEPLFKNIEDGTSIVSKANPNALIPLEMQRNDSDSTLVITVCRICLENDLLQPIFRAEPPMPGKYDTAAKIAFVCPTLRKVKEDDGYPQWICSPCINRLNVAFEFLQTAIQSDKRTSEFYPVPNGVLTKKCSKLPQMTTNQHAQSTTQNPRKCFRHKMYMAKDLVTGKINFIHKTKEKIRRMARQKIVYKTKDLPQRTTTSNTRLKSRRLISDSRRWRVSPFNRANERTNALSSNQNINNVLCLNCKTQTVSGVCPTCEPVKVMPVVKLYLNNVLYCLSCKTQTISGICSTCGPIKVKMLRCKGCKKSYRRPVGNDQLSFFCLQCRKEFMAMSCPTQN